MTSEGQCKICRAPNREDIEAALLAGATKQEVSKRFQFSWTLVDKHSKHMSTAPVALVKAMVVAHETKVARKLFNVVESMQDAHDLSMRHHDNALKADDEERQQIKVALLALRQRMDVVSMVIAQPKHEEPVPQAGELDEEWDELDREVLEIRARLGRA